MDERLPLERRLDDDARARRRAELMEALAHDSGGPTSRARRWLAPVGVAAAVALVVVAVGVLVDGGDQRASEPGAAGERTGAPQPSYRGDVSPGPSTGPPCVAASGAARTVPSDGKQLRHELLSYRKLLPDVQAYRDIVARHLDPAGEHLDARATGVQSGTDECNELSALGTKLGWSVPGQDGLGEVQVEVSTSWQDAQIHLAHEGWRDAKVDLPRVIRAWSVKYDGGFAVAVTRDDGLTVALDANELFGNDSLVGISGFPFSPDDLFATAADPAFTLP